MVGPANRPRSGRLSDDRLDCGDDPASTLSPGKWGSPLAPWTRIVEADELVSARFRPQGRKRRAPLPDQVAIPHRSPDRPVLQGWRTSARAAPRTAGTDRRP